MTTISVALREAVQQLAARSDTPNLDAQVLLSNILNKPRAWILSHPDELISNNHLIDWQIKLESLVNGVPLPYIIGTWEFYGLEFTVSPNTLIPRPESEILVEQALSWIKQHPGCKPLIADIGTGSGCIAISLAVHQVESHLIATDISYPALTIASSNSRIHGVADRIDFIQTDLLTPLKTKFDLICANLPYLPKNTLINLEVFGREPSLALNGGVDGMGIITSLLEIAPDYIHPGGMILLEIESSQGKKAQAQAKQNFPGAEIGILPDLAGHDRLLRIRIPDKFH